MFPRAEHQPILILMWTVQGATLFAITKSSAAPSNQVNQADHDAQVQADHDAQVQVTLAACTLSLINCVTLQQPVGNEGEVSRSGNSSWELSDREHAGVY